MLVLLIELYSFVVFGAIIASWFSAPDNNPIVKLLRQLTEPVLEPLRRVLPSAGGLDLSPMLLLIGLQLLKSFLIGL
jgi:YggT family protein